MRFEHFGQPRARHDAVLDVVVRRDAAHRRERRLASAPDARALLVGLRDVDGRRAVALAGSDHDVEERADLRRRAVELDDQHRVGVGEVGMHGGLGRANRQRVHHFDGGRNDPGRDDVGHDCAAGVDGVERRQQRLHGLGPAQHPHGDPGHDRERPFRSDDQAEQIGSRRIRQRAAEMDDRRRPAAPLRRRERGGR